MATIQCPSLLNGTYLEFFRNQAFKLSEFFIETCPSLFCFKHGSLANDVTISYTYNICTLGIDFHKPFFLC